MNYLEKKEEFLSHTGANDQNFLSHLQLFTQYFRWETIGEVLNKKLKMDPEQTDHTFLLSLGPYTP